MEAEIVKTLQDRIALSAENKLTDDLFEWRRKAFGTLGLEPNFLHGIKVVTPDSSSMMDIRQYFHSAEFEAHVKSRLLPTYVQHETDKFFNAVMGKKED